MKFYRDGAWYPHAMRIYNVQCWYADNACEIFQIVAFGKEDAISQAKTLAIVKGYHTCYNDCDFVI